MQRQKLPEENIAFATIHPIAGTPGEEQAAHKETSRRVTTAIGADGSPRVISTVNNEAGISTSRALIGKTTPEDNAREALGTLQAPGPLLQKLQALHFLQPLPEGGYRLLEPIRCNVPVENSENLEGNQAAADKQVKAISARLQMISIVAPQGFVQPRIINPHADAPDASQSAEDRQLFLALYQEKAHSINASQLAQEVEKFARAQSAGAVHSEMGSLLALGGREEESRERIFDWMKKPEHFALLNFSSEQRKGTRAEETFAELRTFSVELVRKVDYASSIVDGVPQLTVTVTSTSDSFLQNNVSLEPVVHLRPPATLRAPGDYNIHFGLHVHPWTGQVNPDITVPFERGEREHRAPAQLTKGPLVQNPDNTYSITFTVRGIFCDARLTHDFGKTPSEPPTIIGSDAHLIITDPLTPLVAWNNPLDIHSLQQAFSHIFSSPDLAKSLPHFREMAGLTQASDARFIASAILLEALNFPALSELTQSMADSMEGMPAPSRGRGKTLDKDQALQQLALLAALPHSADVKGPAAALFERLNKSQEGREFIDAYLKMYFPQETLEDEPKSGFYPRKEGFANLMASARNMETFRDDVLAIALKGPTKSESQPSDAVREIFNQFASKAESLLNP